MKQRSEHRSKLHGVFVAALSVLTTLGSAACSDERDHADSASERVGTLGLGLVLDPNVVLDTISYEITGAGFTLTGTLPVPGTGTTFSATVTDIPVGQGHRLRLSSRALGDAGLGCVGDAIFDSVLGATTQVNVTLLCDALDNSGATAINGAFNVCPAVTSTAVTPTVQTVGGTILLALASRDIDNGPSAPTYVWSATSGSLANPTSSSPTFTCTAPGPVSVQYSVSDGNCSKGGVLSATCVAGDAGTDGGFDAGVANDAGAPRTVVINEVESNGGTPGDWAELYNAGSQAVDVSGFVFKDNDDTRTFRIAAGSVIAPGAYLVLEEAQFGYGLGAADATRLYAVDGVTLLDTYNWTAHAASTYGRCPNGTGAFRATLSTKGAVNDCSASSDAGVSDAGAADAGGDAASSSLPWPGASTVVEVDALNAFPSNLSGLAYQAGALPASSVLWGIQNDPSKIYRLQPNGALWTSPASGEWSAGKQIFYPTGAGRPDSEGIALVPGDVAGSSFLYVASERDNGANTISRLAILQIDPNAAGTTLTALREWVLTSDLPAVGANLGLEGIAFVSDAELTAQSFREGNGQPYNQARFAQHGGGVFLVGVEGTGAIHVYALNHADGTFARLATFSSGMPGVMDLMYDPDTNYLWAYGDDTVGNQAVLFEIEPNMASLSYGQFVQRRVFQRPSGLPNSNNEGISFAPESECAVGVRSFFWSDDSNAGGHALRRGSIPCGRAY